AYERAIDAGAIEPQDVWARIRLALQHGQVSLARSLAKYLPAREGLDAKALSAAASDPRKYLERRGRVPATRGGREILLFALQRLARTSPQEAAARFQPLAADLPRGDREYMWGRLGYY